MKNFTHFIIIFLFVSGNALAQQEKGISGTSNWLYNWTEFKPGQEDYDEPTQILTGNITTNIKLFKRETYLLVGNVFVTNNATLTIEPGTVIIGDYETKATLTIARGSTIIADGLETDPIVFTSNRSVKKSGDWGGIIILGDAPTSKFGNGSVASFYSKLNASNYGNTNFGGENTGSCSGILRFVRIEYAGKRIKKTGEYFNALLLASVGNNTLIDNIMISYAAGNSFEIWGGEVNLDRLVSYKSSSIDFKFNYGAQCLIQNSLAVRSPYISSNTGTRCLEIASFENREEVDFTKKGTTIIAKNLTLVNESDDLASDIKKGLVKEAVFVGENASLDMNKTVISGFNPAIVLDNTTTVNQENLQKIKLTDMYFNNCNGNIFTENNPNNDDLENWYGNSAFLNVYSKSTDAETFIDMKNKRTPDFRLRINKIIAQRK